jgi:leucyl-tRNA synthetase
VLREALEAALVLLAPFVPHVANELWERTGHDTALDAAGWPTWNEAALVEHEVEIPVQVNGRVRGRIRVPRGAGEDAVVAAALADENVRSHLEAKTLVKRILVPERLLNLVVR